MRIWYTMIIPMYYNHYIHTIYVHISTKYFKIHVYKLRIHFKDDTWSDSTIHLTVCRKNVQATDPNDYYVIYVVDTDSNITSEHF